MMTKSCSDYFGRRVLLSTHLLGKSNDICSPVASVPVAMTSTADGILILIICTPYFVTTPFSPSIGIPLSTGVMFVMLWADIVIRRVVVERRAYL